MGVFWEGGVWRTPGYVNVNTSVRLVLYTVPVMPQHAREMFGARVWRASLIRSVFTVNNYCIHTYSRC